MGWMEGLVWGVLGGFAMESLEFIEAVRRYGRLPWQRHPTAKAGSPAGGIPEANPLQYAIATVLRLCVGAVPACAAARSIADLSPWVALALGAGAPTVLGKLATFIPLAMTTMAQQTLDASAADGPGSAPAVSNGHRSGPPADTAIGETQTPAHEGGN